MDRFIINSHAFHNAHLLRAILPRDLLAPIPLFPQRREKHDEFAATLRGNLAIKASKRKTASAGKKKTVPRKRKAPVQPDDDEGDGGATTKRRRKEPARGSPAEPLLEDGLVAGRAKRKIRRTERAKAADDDTEEDEDNGDSSTDESDVYISSDEYSD